ncbi:MAG TPA: hypothetical protein PKV93_15015, partial [Fervidobacterium sp.]|nr:hypothetical protein [Fervidobacterium sp.]
ATFIAYNYNTPVDPHEFEREAKRILEEVRKECGWMYATLNTEGMSISRETVEELAERVRQAKSGDEVKLIVEENSELMGEVQYTVWSDVFICPNCSQEIVFWDVAFDQSEGKVKDEFSCPHCFIDSLKKRDLERAWVTKFDPFQNTTVRLAKQVPVLVNYKAENGRFERAVDSFDLALIEKIEELEIPYWCPTTPVPEGEKTIEPLRLGITHVHHFYTKRNLRALATLHNEVSKTSVPFLKAWFTSGLQGTSKMYKFRANRSMGILSGTLYVASLFTENSVLKHVSYKARDFARIVLIASERMCLSTGTTSAPTNIPSDSVDYVFTDPPFGGNLMYSELNFLWEAWLGVFTNNKEEAVENKVQGKGL